MANQEMNRANRQLEDQLQAVQNGLANDSAVSVRHLYLMEKIQRCSKTNFQQPTIFSNILERNCAVIVFNYFSF